MNPIGSNLHSVPYLNDIHLGETLQQLRQHAGVAWIQVRHENKSDIAVRRHSREELFESFQAASGRTDPGDAEGRAVTFWEERISEPISDGQTTAVWNGELSSLAFCFSSQFSQS